MGARPKPRLTLHAHLRRNEPAATGTGRSSSEPVLVSVEHFLRVKECPGGPAEEGRHFVFVGDVQFAGDAVVFFPELSGGGEVAGAGIDILLGEAFGCGVITVAGEAHDRHGLHGGPGVGGVPLVGIRGGVAAFLAGNEAVISLKEGKISHHAGSLGFGAKPAPHRQPRRGGNYGTPLAVGPVVIEIEALSLVPHETINPLSAGLGAFPPDGARGTVAELLVKFGEGGFEIEEGGVGIDRIEVGAALIKARGKVPHLAFGDLVMEITHPRNRLRGDILESFADHIAKGIDGGGIGVGISAVETVGRNAEGHPKRVFSFEDGESSG